MSEVACRFEWIEYECWVSKCWNWITRLFIEGEPSRGEANHAKQCFKQHFPFIDIRLANELNSRLFRIDRVIWMCWVIHDPGMSACHMNHAFNGNQSKFHQLLNGPPPKTKWKFFGIFGFCLFINLQPLFAICQTEFTVERRRDEMEDDFNFVFLFGRSVDFWYLMDWVTDRQTNRRTNGCVWGDHCKMPAVVDGGKRKLWSKERAREQSECCYF